MRFKIDPASLEHALDFITSSHVVSDLPYGEKTLKLTSGETLTIPNQVRSQIPSQIIKHYQQYCLESNFDIPLGERTLYRIISSCSATYRSSMQGLDYFTVDASKGFDTLMELVAVLRDQCIVSSECDALVRSLMRAKQYLKGTYRVS